MAESKEASAEINKSRVEGPSVPVVDEPHDIADESPNSFSIVSICPVVDST
jgi:hypothetical protein